MSNRLGFWGVAALYAGLSLWGGPAAADWQAECSKIEKDGPSPGACESMIKTNNLLQPYAPLRPFHDTSINGKQLNPLFQGLWGEPQWASREKGDGGTILGPTEEDRGETGNEAGSSGTFN